MSKNPENTIASRGPFEMDVDGVIPEKTEVQIVRNLDCAHYTICLNLAVALDWESFTCEGCSGEINESLKWRAGQSARRDSVTRALCPMPEIKLVKGDSTKS
jgi:hypothetical protein